MVIGPDRLDVACFTGDNKARFLGRISKNFRVSVNLGGRREIFGMINIIS